ncbi:HK97 family phage portal protein [Mycoplasmopsis mustelae]|uniref:HK97 family phage portal protein n=1 Tax=Mycoplasmopsis mustelae TaxID=171289 RepID=A0A4V3FNW1_9BACT|nr:phage portal protein [Mycoplasmopsis mustelae]TDV23499.1 HK97 family phage portal protein [Mycoplasmopsis mustelae]
MASIFKNLKNLFTPKRINDIPEIGYRNFSISLSDPIVAKTIKTLTPAEFLTFGLAVRAVQMIANDIAKVNFRHSKYNKDNDSENINNSQLLKILNKKPNDKQTPWEFKKSLIWNLLIYGSAPLLKVSDQTGALIELIPVYPPYLTKKQKDNGETFYQFKRDNNDPINFLDDEIIFIEYEIIPGFDTANIRTLFKSTISKIRENELSMLNAIANDLSTSLFIKIKESTNPEQRRLANTALKEMLENQKKSGSFGIVIDEKWDIGQATEIINARIDFQTRNSLGREFAASLGIPPAKLGIDDPNKYNSSAELNRAYVDNSLKPLLINICEKLTDKLLSNDDEFITFRTLDLLSIDLKAIQEFATSAINSGYATANEIRALIGLDKHPDGDHLLANGALTPINSLINNNNQTPPKTSDNENQSDDKDEQTTQQEANIETDNYNNQKQTNNSK